MSNEILLAFEANFKINRDYRNPLTLILSESVFSFMSPRGEVYDNSISKPLSHNILFSSRDQHSKKIVIAMLVLISSLIASNMIYAFLLADTLVGELSSNLGISLFVSLAVIPNVAGYYVLRRFIAPVHKAHIASNASSSSSSFFRLTYSLLRVAFFSNAMFLAIIIIEIVFSSKFHVGLSVFSIQVNTVLVIILSTFLSYKFLSWYKGNRELTVLLFGLTFATVAVTWAIDDGTQTAFFLLNDGLGRIEEPHVVPDEPEGSTNLQSSNQKSDPILHTFFLLRLIPGRIAFVLYWIGTALLLRRYSTRIGRLKFWIILSLPLVILFVASIFIFGGIVGTQLFRGVVTAISTVLGGVLFGVIFLTIARGLEQKKQQQYHRGSTRTISQYLTMSAFGIILYLVATTPPSHIIDWVHIPYPPFANVVWSFAAFAVYLYSFGFYFSTLLISQDTNLRKSVQKLAIDEANMLHNLGFEQMQREIQERVVKLTKEQEELLKEQTGIEQYVSEEEMKEYVKEVMDKVGKSQSG
jgi:hypothetical protein